MWPLNLTKPFFASQSDKVWLTKHTQLSVGINKSVAILCYALVHPRILKRQAAEPHFFPVKLKKIQNTLKDFFFPPYISPLSTDLNSITKQLIEIKMLIVDTQRDR